MSKLAAGLAFVISFVIFIPALFGFFNAPEGSYFITLQGEDEYNHLTWLYQARRGRWIFRSPYILTPHKGMFFQPLYLLEGKIAALACGFLPKIGSLSLAPIYVYQFFRPLTAFFLLASIWAFITLLLKDQKQRLFTFLFVAFSGGLGWLEFFRPNLTYLGTLSMANILNEANTFWSMESYPHYSLSQALMVLTFLFFLKNLKTSRLLFLLLSGFSSFFLFLIHPLDFPTIYVVLAFFTFLSLKEGTLIRLTLKNLLPLGLFFLVSSPPLFYYLWLIRVDPKFAVWPTLKDPTPSLFKMLPVFGFLIPLFLLGTYHVFKKKKAFDLFLVIWAFSSWVLIYSPFNFQRRLVEGMHIPLAILSAIGIWENVKGFKFRVLTLGTVFIACSLSAPFFLYRDIFWLRLGTKRHFLSRNTLQGLAWLSQNTTINETVLGPPSEISFAIPSLGGNKIFYGHWFKPEIDALKKHLLNSFFSADKTDRPSNVSFLNAKNAKEFLAYWGIEFVFLDKEQFPHFDGYYPSQLPYLVKQFENKNTVIYKTLL